MNDVLIMAANITLPYLAPTIFIIMSITVAMYLIDLVQSSFLLNFKKRRT